MSINPYELFGLTSDSSLEDLKKSFKNLSLTCHPDKNGRKEDMEKVYSSYLWLREQIENGMHGRTMEEEEKEFKLFMEKQESVKIPSMFEILTDGFNKRFNEEFEKTEKIKMTYQIEEDKDFEVSEESVMIKYEKPISFNEVGCTTGFLDLTGNVKDFTGEGGYDYRKAFRKEKIIDKEISDESFEKRLERLKREREKPI